MSAAAVVAYDPLRDKTYQSTRLGRDIADFLAWCELGGMSPKTLVNYEPDLARGALMFPDKGIGEITGGDLLHIAKQFPPRSRRVRMSAWRSFYKWARRTRRVLENPCEELPDIRKTPQRVIDTFTEEEIEALLSLPVRDAGPIALLLEAGLRKAEASRIRLHDCLPQKGTVTVLEGKGRRDRIVPMSPRLHGILVELVVNEGLVPTDHIFYAVKANQFEQRKILRGKPVGEATFARWWRSCLRQAAVRYRNPHTARHTYATRLRRQGVAIDDISILLGHASISTTSELYVHTRVDEIASRLRTLNLAVTES
jgi:integrase/recombinase XerD